MKLGNQRREYNQMPRKEWTKATDEDDLDLEDEDEFEEIAADSNFAPAAAAKLDTPADGPAKPEDCSSVLGAGSTWQGNFSSEGSVRLDGHISGEVKAAGTVHIGQGAEVNATVQGKYIVVAGSFDGQMYCSDRVVLQPTSKVRGSITTRTFSVGEGAFIDGEIRMVDELPAAIAPAAVATATRSNAAADRSPLFERTETAPLAPDDGTATEGKRNGANTKARA